MYILKIAENDFIACLKSYEKLSEAAAKSSESYHALYSKTYTDDKQLAQKFATKIKAVRALSKSKLALICKVVEL